MAKPASPWRVRQHPPELRCWTLTGRMVRSASLLVKMSRSGRVTKRRMPSWYRWNRRGQGAALAGCGAVPEQAGGDSPGGGCLVAGGQVLGEGGVQGGLPGAAGGGGGVAGPEQ